MVGFGFSISAVKFFQFGSRDDGEVADLFGDGDEDMVVMLQSEEERQERLKNYRNFLSLLLRLRARSMVKPKI